MNLKTLLISTSMAVALSVNAQDNSNIELPSATNQSAFSLNEVKTDLVALHFLLKTECPYCLRHTADYAAKEADLPEVTQVFIKPDSEEEIRSWTEYLDEDKGGLTIYRDAEATLAKRLEVPFGYKFHGQVVHFPALILLNKNGQEVFRYVGKSNADRLPFEVLVTKVEELRTDQE
jgi:peroxiredoxin Q/BCP